MKYRLIAILTVNFAIVSTLAQASGPSLNEICQDALNSFTIGAQNVSKNELRKHLEGKAPLGESFFYAYHEDELRSLLKRRGCAKEARNVHRGSAKPHQIACEARCTGAVGVYAAMNRDTDYVYYTIEEARELENGSQWFIINLYPTWP